VIQLQLAQRIERLMPFTCFAWLLVPGGNRAWKTFKSSITNWILAKPFYLLMCVCTRKKQGSHFLATLFGESGPAWRSGPEPRNRSLDDCRDRTRRARLRPDQSAPAIVGVGVGYWNEAFVRIHGTLRSEERMIQIRAVLFLKTKLKFPSISVNFYLS